MARSSQPKGKKSMCPLPFQEQPFLNCGQSCCLVGFICIPMCTWLRHHLMCYEKHSFPRMWLTMDFSFKQFRLFYRRGSTKGSVKWPHFTLTLEPKAFPSCLWHWCPLLHKQTRSVFGFGSFPLLHIPTVELFLFCCYHMWLFYRHPKVSFLKLMLYQIWGWGNGSTGKRLRWKAKCLSVNS